MAWADSYIATLREGHAVAFRPRGSSMVPKIHSGDLCTVTPLAEEAIAVGDIVLCKVGGSQYLHLVKAVQGDRYQIGNNRGGINGWVGRTAIYGRLVSVAR
jgi:phage repressor protein C with HTH and peptisase S24 domain